MFRSVHTLTLTDDVTVDHVRHITPGGISAKSLKSITTAIQPVSFALKAGGKQRNTTPSSFLTGVRRDLPL